MDITVAVSNHPINVLIGNTQRYTHQPTAMPEFTVRSIPNLKQGPPFEQVFNLKEPLPKMRASLGTRFKETPFPHILSLNDSEPHSIRFLENFLDPFH